MNFAEKLRLPLVAIALLLSASSAAAEDCTLSQVASLDIVDAKDGRVLVPVSFNGTTVKMLLDLSGERTILSEYAGEHLNLPVKDLSQHEQATYWSQVLHQGFVAKSVALGEVAAHDIAIPATAYLVPAAPQAAGVLGLDLLHNFDIELDFAKHKMNLFTQDHCPGHAVYWAKSFTSVPMTIKQTVLRIGVTLDGHDLVAGINTIRTPAYMPMTISKIRMQIDTKSDGIARAPDEPDWFDNYTYPFKKLTIGGLMLFSPSIIIYNEIGTGRGVSGMTDVECSNRVQIVSPTSSANRTCWLDLFVGMEVLRSMHLFFAFKEGVLYVTPAGAT